MNNELVFYTNPMASSRVDLAQFYEKMGREIDSRHQTLRSWPPYFHLRELQRRFDILPGSLPVGADFEAWLVKK